MSQNMIALKRQLMQSKLSVLMPCKWGPQGGGAESLLGAAPLPPPPLEPPMLDGRQRHHKSVVAPSGERLRGKGRHGVIAGQTV